MDRYIIFFLLFLFSYLDFSLFAQTDPPLRIELESGKDQQDYQSVSLKENGVAVFYQSAILSADTAQWVFIQYDTNLVRKNIYKIKIPNLCQYCAADFSDDKLFLFLQKPSHKKDTLKNYLLEWDINQNVFQLHDLKNYKYPTLSAINVSGDHLFIKVDDKNAKSIIYYNYKQHTKHAIQFADDEITSIESFIIDSLSKKTYFCMFLKNKKGTRAELFVTDFDGNIKERLILPFYSNVVYNSVNALLTNKEALLLVGGYSNPNEKKPNGCYSGIYSMQFVNHKFTDIQTYSFGALLGNDSISAKRAINDPNTTMLAHILQSNGNIFVITDIFSPEYQYTNSNRGFGYYGYSGYDPPTQVFVGFRYTNAYILQMNKMGLVNHEWVFPIKNVLQQTLTNLVKVYQDKEENSLFYYVYQNEIVTQLMQKKNVLDAQTATPISLMSKSDILEYSSNIKLKHWYGNSFILSGYQYIKNTNRGKGKRYVFFVNKLINE